LATGKPLATVPLAFEVHAVALTPDGKTLAVAVENRDSRIDPDKRVGVQIWDVVAGRHMRSLTANQPVTVLAFAPDGKTLASGTRENELPRLWDASTGKETIHFQDLSDRLTPIHALAFAPNGKLLAAGRKSTVELWDLSTGRLRLAHDGHRPGAA